MEKKIMEVLERLTRIEVGLSNHLTHHDKREKVWIALFIGIAICLFSATFLKYFQ